MENSRRTFVVFASLVTVLTLTSALLLALAPAPLLPSSSTSLFAVDQPDSLELIFQTETPVEAGRWQYIYIHHSHTHSGNAFTLSHGPSGMADHFLIGNGDGAIDGEIQIGHRWNRQLSALAPAGASGIDPACISICLVGDFDSTVPTRVQLRRLTQLVNALQARYDIPAENVLMVNHPGTPAGIGRYFPATAFREQLQP